MVVTVILGALALLSFALLLWQFTAALRFPLHARTADGSFRPAVTLLKPLKGCDEHTADCLRSWLMQDYGGPVQVLLGVADEEDPVCHVVRELLKRFPHVDAELIIARELLGTNAKVSTLVQLDRHARHGIVCVSDADVFVPVDYLTQAVNPLRDSGIGLVNGFYQLAAPATLAMRWEAVAVNADFWSQVLQSNTLKPQDFALGAAMLARRDEVAKIGGFETLLNCLADDYQLGHRIAATGARVALTPVVVECRDKPANFAAVWKHQLRWARTIRVSQPVPYFFSILSNVTLWAALLALFGNLGGFPVVPDSLLYSRTLPVELQNLLAPLRMPWVLVAFAIMLSTRVILAGELQCRLARRRGARQSWWMVIAKDLLGVAIWAASFLGNTIEWRGRVFRLNKNGELIPS